MEGDIKINGTAEKTVENHTFGRSEGREFRFAFKVVSLV
jgi:hypothetical protein